MKKKSLIETNPYMKDPLKRRAAFIKTVISSSAIEGIHVTAADLESLAPEETDAVRHYRPAVSVK
jgi:Fic family protein